MPNVKPLYFDQPNNDRFHLAIYESVNLTIHESAHYKGLVLPLKETKMYFVF